MDHAVKIRRSGLVYKIAYDSDWFKAPACPNVCHLVKAFLVGFVLGVLLWKLFDYVFLRLIGGVIAITLFFHRPLLKWSWPKERETEGAGAIYVPIFKIPRILFGQNKKGGDDYLPLYPLVLIVGLGVVGFIGFVGWVVFYLILYVAVGQRLVGNVILPSPEAKIISLASVLAVILAVAAILIYGKIRKEEWWLLLCAYLKGKKQKVCLPVDFVD